MRAYGSWGMTLAIIGGACLAAPAPGTAQDALPAAEEIIDRHVQAIGGRDAVLRHASSRVTGTFAMPAAGIEGTLVVLAARPNLNMTRVEIPGLGTILSGFDGEVGWSMDPNLGPRLLEGNELEATKEGSSQLAAVRDPSLFDVRETVERAEMNGQPCFKVRLVWKSGRESFDCYSIETGLLVGGLSRQDSPMGTIETVTLLDDYREVDGVRSATRIRQQVLGQEQVMILDTIEYDVVEPDAFTPPDPIRVLIEQRAEG
jgi:hypothetical protein